MLRRLWHLLRGHRVEAAGWRVYRGHSWRIWHCMTCHRQWFGGPPTPEPRLAADRLDRDWQETEEALRRP